MCVGIIISIERKEKQVKVKKEKIIRSAASTSSIPPPPPSHYYDVTILCTVKDNHY